MASSGTDPTLFLLLWFSAIPLSLALMNGIFWLARNQHELRQRANIWLDKRVNPEPDFHPAHRRAYEMYRDVRIIDGEEG